MRNHAYGITATGDALLDTSMEMSRVAAVSGTDVDMQNTTSLYRRGAAHAPKLTQILTALDAVNQRDQATLSQLFALDGATPITLAPRAGIHSLTSERVRQIKQAAIENAHRSPYAAALVAY